MITLLILFAGIAAGYLLRRWRCIRFTRHTLTPTVWILLFVFGAHIGSEREIMADFGRFGAQAALLAVAGVAGSIVAAMILTRVVSRRKGGAR